MTDIVSITDLASTTSRSPASTPRAIVFRTRGSTHGPITRLVSPGDVGELIKPFVFLDEFAVQGARGGFGWHPHSGIATLTVLLDGAMRYEETTGASGVLEAGAVEWMRAGGGVWHTGGPHGDAGARGFQLWVALPPSLENAPCASRYLNASEVPAQGPVRVILGSHLGVVSAIDAPPGMNYLVVTLAAGERWTYEPPPGHTVAWIAVHQGAVRAPTLVQRGELAVFEASNQAIDLVAEGATQLVLGSAAPHPHPLVLGSYSVHTSEEALERGEAEIVRIRDEELRPRLER